MIHHTTPHHTTDKLIQLHCTSCTVVSPDPALLGILSRLNCWICFEIPRRWDTTSPPPAGLLIAGIIVERIVVVLQYLSIVRMVLYLAASPPSLYPSPLPPAQPGFLEPPTACVGDGKLRRSSAQNIKLKTVSFLLIWTGLEKWWTPCCCHRPQYYRLSL